MGKYKYWTSQKKTMPDRYKCECIEYWDGFNARWLPSNQPFEHIEKVYRYKDKK